MKINKSKIILIFLLLIFNSCKKTNLNKYCINNIEYKVYSLNQINKNHYNVDSFLIKDANKKYLILLTLNKDFVSINPSDGGYPNEGMEGKADSIIYSSFDLISKDELHVKTNINNIVNFTNSKLIKDCYENVIYNDSSITFKDFIKYYNTSLDESYGSSKFFIPFILDYKGYIEFIKNRKYVKLKKKNKIEVLKLI